MTNIQRRGNVCTDGDMPMSVRVDREVEVLMFTKQRFDLDYPDHKKDFRLAELKQVARDKVIRELSVPPCASEDESL